MHDPVGKYIISADKKGRRQFESFGTNIKNAKGENRFQSFQNLYGFVGNGLTAIKRFRSKIINTTCTVDFETMPFGKYNKPIEGVWFQTIKRRNLRALSFEEPLLTLMLMYLL